MSWFERSSVIGRKSRNGIVFPFNDGGQNPVRFFVERDQRLHAGGARRGQLCFPDVATREAELGLAAVRFPLSRF